MLQNYLTIAWRNILRYKLYAFINILGLGISLSFLLLIYLFLQHELSYDDYPKNNRIFAIGADMHVGPSAGESKLTLPYPIASTLAQSVPEITNFSRYRTGDKTIGIEDKLFVETVSYVDSGFFNMFSLLSEKTSIKVLFDQPNSVVISDKLAQKYFPSQSPVGQTLEIDQRPFLISEVVETKVKNTSFTTDVFLPIESYYGNQLSEYENNWQTFTTNAFIELQKGTNANELRQKIHSLLYAYMAPPEEIIKQYFPDFQGEFFTTQLVPLNSLHFSKATSGFLLHRSNINYVYILSAVAVLILLMTCANYIMLALANSSSRYKEVGIRKVLGANAIHLRQQFWGEAILLSLIALTVALTLAQIFLPRFNNLIGRTLEFDFIHQPQILAAAIFIAIMVGLLAGGYPALWLSRMIPLRILKGHSLYKINPKYTGTLVVIQFTICLFFISCTIVMNKQMQFIGQKDLGFDQEQLIQLNLYAKDLPDASSIYDRLQHSLQDNTSILSMSAIQNFPYPNTEIVKLEAGESVSANWFGADAHWRETLEVELLEGRDFSTQLSSDSIDAIIINETMAIALGLNDPIGSTLNAVEHSYQVIGVVKDFFYAPLTEKLAPTFIKLSTVQSPFLVRIAPNQLPQAITELKSIWEQQIADAPLPYSFLDEQLASRYENAQQFQKLTTYATLFGILVACLGLFGLSGLQAISRTQEVAIRKVFGASLLWLMVRLNRSTFVLSLIAFLLAAPISLLLMEEWLNSFAYRVQVRWYWLLISAALGIGISLVTVNYHLIKVARTNPAKSLRNE